MPTLDRIDHIHVYVNDRVAAADWFRDLFGFEAVAELGDWVTPQGPLTIANPAGSIHLALFQRDDPPSSTAIAFGTDAGNFLLWKAELEARGILQRCSDHDLAWSLYFSDPDDNVYEITTYDHTAVAQALGRG